MKIRLIYDPILRQNVSEVTVFNDALKNTAEKMLEIMKQHDGIGLAANQVGENLRMFVCGYKRTSEDDELPDIPFTAFVNPKITKFSKEKDVLNEGCLSLPTLELPVVRSTGVEVEYFDLSGAKKKLRAKGIFARVIQHEVDHLNGVLFTDRAENVSLLKNYSYAKIVFCGSDDFSLPILQALINNNLNVISVITESAKRSGRGDSVKKTAVEQYCNENGINVFTPNSKEEITSILRQLGCDLLVLASYGKILEQESLEAPRYGCLNIHPSLLPKYRGATPIQSAIINNDPATGVTLMKMNAQVDEGLIIDQQQFAYSDQSYTELKEKLAEIGASMLVKNIPMYLAGQSKFTQQTGEVIKTKKLNKEMGEINWDNDIEVIYRNILALNPWPGTYTFLDGKRLKIIKAKLNLEKLELIEVQLEGKNPTNYKDFYRGYAQQLTKAPWFSKIA